MRMAYEFLQNFSTISIYLFQFITKKSQVGVGILLQVPFFFTLLFLLKLKRENFKATK